MFGRRQSIAIVVAIIIIIVDVNVDGGSVGYFSI